MAMHSYLRPSQHQTNSVNPDQMHSFLKDKQAWEHAISVYQGPDPLDHWYNYICWYENHTHNDPEHKFRETLERCLTVYEHSDFYRQDVRLIRLWLKYIAMQPEPLHFYQVLFQRGTGRQVAAFYIGWASYYESREEFKDAEAVFNLAFQEKAQTAAELHHAHNKFAYVRSLYYQQQQHQIQAQPAPPPQDALQQLATYTQTHHQQQLSHGYAQHHHPPAQQPQQPPPPLQHHQHQQTQYQQTHHIYHQAQQHPTQYPQPDHELQAPHPNQAPPPHAYQAHQQHTQQQQQPQAAPLHYAPHEQHYDQSPQQQQPQQPITNAEVHTHQSTYGAVQARYPYVMRAHNQQTTPHYEAEQPPQPLEAPHNLQEQEQAAMPPEQPLEQQQIEQQQLEHVYQNGNDETMQATNLPIQSTTEVPGLRLPRNFHAYGRNNHETWKPALTLEEPDDPRRVCHYPKQLVYPPGAGIEYSPEELKARKYAQLLECKRKQHELVQQQLQQEQLSKETQHETYTSAVLESQQQQQLYDSYESDASYYITAAEGALNAHNNSSSASYNGAEHLESEGQEGADEEDENEGEENEDDEDEDDDDEAAEADEIDDAYTNGHVASQVSYGMQFSAQTTYEEQNRSIKIKFKKERTADTPDTNAYSTYTIESIYHQQLPVAPNSPRQEGNLQQRQRNGYHFHPYMLGQTSTPKTESHSNGFKRGRGKVKRNKFQPDFFDGNSNSSSSQAELALNGEAIASKLTPAAAAEAAKPAVAVSAAASAIHNATFNDNANFSFSSASALENSNSSLASAVDRLNFRDVSSQMASSNNNKTLQAHNNNSTMNNNNHNATATNSIADFSTFQENSYFATQHDTEAKERRLSKALETIARHLAKEAIDPFNSELCRAFLAKLDFPGDDAHASYKIVQTPLPKIYNTRTLNVLEGVQFNIDKEVGRGSYGNVYKATDVRTSSVVALKFQKPPNTWEIYICDQVLKRIKDPKVLPGFMDISTAIIAPNASLIATEFSPFGSLLDINNKIRQATTKVMHESLVMHFSAQICNIVDHLHRQHIIHADIKPDNFLLMRVPNVDSAQPSLRLIDFGCAIDMSLFPDGERTKFRKVIQTDGFTCIEMQEGRPWSYETDLFCIAGTVHVMLFGEYMQPQKRGSHWDIRQKLPRYLKKHVWTKFFGELLNTKADKLPNLQEMRDIIDEECYRMDSELQKQIRTLSNILHRR